MIRRHHNTKFLFLFLQAIAVAIICLGSLINFHQYKIWGKPLIPNFVGYKRDIEKYSKVASFSKFSRGDHFSQKHFSGSDGIFSPDDRLQHLGGWHWGAGGGASMDDIGEGALGKLEIADISPN